MFLIQMNNVQNHQKLLEIFFNATLQCINHVPWQSYYSMRKKVNLVTVYETLLKHV